MDRYARPWWELRFENEFLRSTGTEFQALFTRIMELRHAGDFTQVRPWGNTGDQKCDGWLASEKRLFQVYAPNEMTRAQTEAKMDEDINGALQHWGGQFDHWTFVHNSRSGVPPFVLQKLLAFRGQRPGIEFTPWGYAELRTKLFELSDPDVGAILGPAVSAAAMQSVRLADVEKVLKHVHTEEVPLGADLRPVPGDKVAANLLSADVSGFLRLGMMKAPLVGRFFSRYPDPRYGDALAFQFKERYEELRHRGVCPDDIFWELRGYAGANDATSDREQAAALAIIAHFFEVCDIFERPETQRGAGI